MHILLRSISVSAVFVDALSVQLAGGGGGESGGGGDDEDGSGGDVERLGAALRQHSGDRVGHGNESHGGEHHHAHDASEERAVDAQLQPRAELDVHETRAYAHNRKHAGDYSELRIQADGHQFDAARVVAGMRVFYTRGVASESNYGEAQVAGVRRQREDLRHTLRPNHD